MLIHVQALQLANSIFININTTDHHLTIGSQYTRATGNLDHDLLEWSNNFPSCDKLLIGGDFNAHITAWGYKRNNNKGETLQDYIALNDLCILNDPESDKTYYSVSHK